MMLHTAFQNVFIAVLQVLTERIGQIAVHDRADCVNDIIAGKLICACQGCSTGGLPVVFAVCGSFSCHDLMAFFPKLHACRAVNGVVNASVTGDEAAKHL